MRSGAGLTLAASLALTGCSSSTKKEPDFTPTQPATSALPAPTDTTPAPDPAAPPKVEATLDNIRVDGAKGAQPLITVPAPWAVENTTVKVLDEGTGPAVSAGTTVLVNYTGVNGRTGKVFDSSYLHGGLPIAFPLTGVVTGFAKGLQDQKIGSRVLIAMTGADGYDSKGGQAGSGINVGDTLIFAVEIVDAQQSAVWGTPVPAKDGLPKVAADAKNPAVEVPAGYAAPADTVAQLIMDSASEHKVVATDSVTVRYSMYSAKTGQQIAHNWDAEKPETGQLSRLLPGWKKGLVNMPVGSRVLLVIPPADGYPNGDTALKIEAGDTLICVVDVLWAGAGQ